MNETSFTELIANCRTEFDVHRACATIGESFGYEFFAIFRMPEQGETKLADLSIASNWPVSFIRQYDELGMLPHSPILKALRKSTVPVVWSADSLEEFEDRETAENLKRLLISHSITSSIYFNVHSAGGRQGTIAFAGDRSAISEAEMVDLSFYASLIFDRSCALSTDENKLKSMLSKRERECIIWTSHGKTSYEIGVILGLSEHTINNYLANVCRKLGAVNRAHLVGIALRNNILA